MTGGEVCPQCGGTGEVPVYENYYWMRPDFTRELVRRLIIGMDPCPECSNA